MRPRGPAFATIAGVVALASPACAPGPGLPQATTVDSAGLRIVAYDVRPEALPAWRSVGPADLEIGVADGPAEYALSRVVDLAVLTDGRVLVSDGAAPGVRVYDDGGRWDRTLGRRGDGPGEFASPPTFAGFNADTVWVYDASSARVTTFLVDGPRIGEMTVQGDAVGRPLTVLRYADGSWVARSRWTRPSETLEFYDFRLELDSVVALHLAPDGSLLDTVRVLPDRTWARTVADRGGGVLRLLQAPQPNTAGAVLSTDGEGPVLGHSSRFELDLPAGEGGMPIRLRVDGVDPTVTAAEIRAWHAAVLREDFGEAEPDPTARMLYQDFLPERLPAFDRVVVAEEGDLWVARSALDDSEGEEWLVFAPDATLRGLVRAPPGLRVLRVTGPALYGVVHDDLDVPYVRRHPLRPADEPTDPPSGNREGR